jgi:hypothetical protein
VTNDDCFKRHEGSRDYLRKGRGQQGGWEEHAEECLLSKFTTLMYENVILNQAPMAIACNLMYLGGWDQENWVQASPGKKKQRN